MLLVEDEPEVLQLVSSHLVGLGHEVTAVSNGIDAVALLKGGRDMDLLLTDVMLPKGMSGVDLARRARSLEPSLKELRASGYSENAFALYGQPEEGTGLPSKPFKRQELAEVLREVLGDLPRDATGDP